MIIGEQHADRSVLRQTVVLPSGEVIKTRSRSRKSSAGFDTTKLFIGAEGTLGIVTEVTIRLAPVLPTTVATVQFPNVRKASEAVIEILNTGIGIRAFVLPPSSFFVSFPLLFCCLSSSFTWWPFITPLERLNFCF
jgi:FAD/FMN-containing dehydrogenase